MNWKAYVELYGSYSVYDHYNQVVKGNLHFGHVIYCPPLVPFKDFVDSVANELEKEFAEAVVYECYDEKEHSGHIYFDVNAELQNNPQITRLKENGVHETVEEGQLRVVYACELKAEQVLCTDLYNNMFGELLIYHALYGVQNFQHLLWLFRTPSIPLHRNPAKYKDMWTCLQAAIFYGVPPSTCMEALGAHFPNQIKAAMTVFSPQFRV